MSNQPKWHNKRYHNLVPYSSNVHSQKQPMMSISALLKQCQIIDHRSVQYRYFYYLKPKLQTPNSNDVNYSCDIHLLHVSSIVLLRACFFSRF